MGHSERACRTIRVHSWGSWDSWRLFGWVPGCWREAGGLFPVAPLRSVVFGCAACGSLEDRNYEVKVKFKESINDYLFCHL